MTKRKRLREDLLTPVGSLGYEIVTRDSLTIAGGKEIQVVFHLLVEDNEGNQHKVLARLDEQSFARMFADIAVDIQYAKRPDSDDLPPPVGGAPSQN